MVNGAYCEAEIFTLPTISFVGGETQDLAFNTYFFQSDKRYSLSGCTANFAVADYLDKTGMAIISKPMTVGYDTTCTIDNVLNVTLTPSETVDLCGKYIYQISMRDIDGDVEIPKQGILLITRNIDKTFING